MKKALRILRNKFALATAIFFVYTMFLDENDIFTIINQNAKLNKLNENTAVMKSDLAETH